MKANSNMKIRTVNMYTEDRGTICEVAESRVYELLKLNG